MCAFPIHIWTFLLSFADFSWIAARTTTWDAIGVMAYGLLFALVESMLIFIIAASAGLLISKNWKETHRIAILSALVFLLSCWVMIGQAYFLWGIPLPGFLLRISAQSDHPVRILYVFTAVIVLLTAIPPVYLILKWDRVHLLFNKFIERLSFLTVFYLFFDALAFLIILIRNL